MEAAYAPPSQTTPLHLTLAIETVCCSITSWIDDLSPSNILSNSSIQQMPWSARTNAPPSRIISPVTGSFITAAVRPTPELPRPVVYWPVMVLQLCEIVTSHTKRITPQYHYDRIKMCNQRTSRSYPVNVREQLALGHSRVTHKEDVDVPSYLHPVRCTVHSSHQ